MIVIFDMDGVILDSEKTLVRIYRALGVDPPENLFDSEGVTWLKEQAGDREEEIRRSKDMAFYSRIVNLEVGRLSGFEAACKLYEMGHTVGLVTSAAYSAVEALWRTCGSKWPFLFTAAKTRPPRRHELFRLMREKPVYVDDQPFQSHAAVCVRYQGQSANNLVEEIRWISV